jgi:acetyl esterase/lipase
LQNFTIEIDKIGELIYSRGMKLSNGDNHRLLKIFCYSILLLGGIFSIIILNGTHGLGFGGDVSQYSLYFSVSVFSATVILLKLKNRKKNSKRFFAIVIIGATIAGIQVTPLISAVQGQKDIENSFCNAFGESWREKLTPEAEFYFQKKPFQITEYFLGKKNSESIIQENILFYDSLQDPFRMDKEKIIRLYFDVYMPPNNGVGLPGQNSTLIRIHGGGWASGDKGFSNMRNMNEYFASQGYVVFDIQYGLFKKRTDGGIILTPDYVRGDFSINDMINQIGIFTNFLERNHKTYGANLSSVFLSGHSAGGHLATVAALGIASMNYSEIFSSKLTIKGYIPFYPGNDLADEYIPGPVRPEFLSPELLVSCNSPPSLVYHGLGDGLVNPEISLSMKNTYEKSGNKKIVLILFPSAAHSSDLYFNGFYNRIFLYYMERFMFIHK